jgi:hypothetical protein
VRQLLDTTDPDLAGMGTVKRTIRRLVQMCKESGGLHDPVELLQNLRAATGRPRVASCLHSGAGHGSDCRLYFVPGLIKEKVNGTEVAGKRLSATEIR